MVRFFVEQKDIYDGTIQLSSEDADHIRALRLRPSELFIVCDCAGSDYICRLGARGDNVAEITGTRPSLGEPTIICSVYIAFAKGDRLTYAVQKSVELGAHGIVLFPSERCISTPNDMAKKTVRLKRVAFETAKQCGRGRIPEIMVVDSFESAIEEAARAELPLFLYECEEKLHLKQALEQHGDPQIISILTGPEGGFSPHEADFAKTAGMLAVTLGPRVLRCETAPAAVLAAVMFHTGNL